MNFSKIIFFITVLNILVFWVLKNITKKPIDENDLTIEQDDFTNDNIIMDDDDDDDDDE
ncbi:hypothetical protein P1A29_13375 [Staphylococcus equorum]|uniref:hypothetical protein n=1 Tax=Staphylococcus TaxID=1279 RepID=UPI001886BF0F|nr:MULTISPECIES: hypothetical protein [Staphylococcus]MBF2779548.1 hypothetical protein [Staphylococcus saprophyticus]MDK9861416.1 hypothetical protein [Staphylococcus equorum]